jgi:pimeloyl-ACP methyl ester carboxylesterase
MLFVTELLARHTGGSFMAFRMFIHGLESSDQGTKAVFFRERYPDMVIPHFTGTFDESMDKLNQIAHDRSGIIFVGSSFGGLMASIFALENESRVSRLILLAPAINRLGLAGYSTRRISIPVWIYHGRNDEVIPLKDVEQTARQAFANLSFHAVEDDHYLHKTFTGLDWDRLIG